MMWSRIYRIARSLEAADTRVAEWFMVMLAATWAVWLTVFNVFGSAKTFYSMSNFAPEWAWATLMLFMTAFQATSLITGSMKYRCVSAFFVTGVWSFVAATFFYSNVATTGAPTYALIAALSLWSFLGLR